MMNDREILELYMRFDERALMETTAKYETYCREIAYTILGDEAAARECFREALYKSWTTSVPKETKNLKTFMGRLTRDAALDYWSEDPTVANVDEIETIAGELEDCVEPGFLGTVSLPEEGRLVGEIDEYLGFLSASKRILFMQRYWYGRSLQAIAKEHGCSEGEVQSELSEVRSGLREVLQEARRLWPPDGKTFLMKQIGEVDNAFILEAEGSIAPLPDETSDPEEAGDYQGKPSKPKKNRKNVCITAVLLAVLGVVVLLCTRFWPMNQETDIDIDIDIDEKHFPDENFRNYVSAKFDLDEDGILSAKERGEVYEIVLKCQYRYDPHYMTQDGSEGYYYKVFYNCSLIDIQSLEGIEFFPNLESLNCSGLLLASLDVSANKKLETLICPDNRLTCLDVSANKWLDLLDCSGNQLTTLDLRTNKILVTLDCRNNCLEELKFRSNELLLTIACDGNQLKSLDVSANKALKSLFCYNNSIEELDLSHNTKLETVDCCENALRKLSLRRNAALIWVDCSDNELTELNVRENTTLEALNCNNNQLKELDLSQNTALTALSCEGNALSSLNVRQCLSLTYLYEGGNPLTDLKVNDNVVTK